MQSKPFAKLIKTPTYVCTTVTGNSSYQKTDLMLILKNNWLVRPD